MSGSSGTNTVEQTIPDWMQTEVQGQYTEGQQTAATPYTAYSGQGVAPLNATQQAGANQLANVGTANTGMSALNSGQTAVQGATGYQPQQVGYQAPTTSQINSYMNPETQSLENASNAQIQEQGNIANQQTAGSATSAGAYGGSRQGVQTALNNQYTGMTQASTDASIGTQAYNTALGQANTNAQSNLTAATSNQNAGLTANQQAITGGMVLGQLGTEQSSTAASNANDVYTAGSTAQQEQQQQDTYNYNNYMQQLMWPFQQQSALDSGIYGGSTGSTTTSPLYSNTLGQVAGLGMAGLGLASSLGAFSSAGAGAGAAAAGAADAGMLLA